ncbi:TonB-dependent receptor [Pseudomonas sp. RIT-PI-AD]|uniref:TonB-dependent receptor family protein n=1 Tax=Pseudomonas sp. RIT-PI-AD TaxID=3035294 RepID=UPI0021D7F424|nr:TonB-dependent receptor [Pseudomonas sp. RIT-PI-AD]
MTPMPIQRRPRGWLALLGCAWLAPLAAAEPARELAPLVITSQRGAAGWLQTPAAVGRVDRDDQPGEQTLTLDRLLAPIPGVFTLDRYNFAQGMRLSIRGFGARANFGVRGVRVRVDGVPLTMPDGQTEMDGLDMGLVERVEVIRGPASSLYGNAAGGVLSIDTREPSVEPYASLDASGGDLGYRRLRAETGGGEGQLAGLLAFNATQLDGYRDHDRAETNSLTGKLGWYADAGTLGLTFNAIDNRAEDPGGLTAAQVGVQRRQAAPNNLRFEADERIRQQRLALVWDGKGPGADEYQLRSYLGHRSFANRLPFSAGGQGAFDREFAGFGGHYSHRAEWLGLAQKITLGMDLENQRDDRRRYDNLLGSRGASSLRQTERAESVGAFLEDEIALGEDWLLSLGGRYDQVRLAVDDRYRADGDDSGSRTLHDWNYSTGLSYRLDEHRQLYGRVGTSFETPTVNELANPAGGGFNAALGPARALNREVGLKGEWSDLRYEAALFSLLIDDELVPYSLPEQPGRNFYRNAGKSRRDGVELGGDWRFAEHWRLSGAYTYNDFRFERYRQANADYDGNALAGIPRQSLFAEMAYQRGDGYARLNLNAFDRLYADDGNAERVPGYALFNARIGQRLRFADQTLEPYLGIDNLLDRRYTDNVRINDANRRYFEPGPGRTLYVGVRAEF